MSMYLEKMGESAGQPDIHVTTLRSPKVASNLIKIAKENTEKAEQERSKDKYDKVRKIFSDNWKTIIKQYLEHPSVNNVFDLSEDITLDGSFGAKMNEIDEFESGFAAQAKAIFVAANRFIRRVEEIDQRENIYGFAGATPNEIEALYADCFGTPMPEEIKDDVIDLCCEDERLEHVKKMVEVFFAGRDLMIPSREWSIDVARDLNSFDFEGYISIARQWWSIYRKSAKYLLRVMHETTRGLGMPENEEDDEGWIDPTDYDSPEWLEAAYDALVNNRYMPAAREYLPHRDDLATLQHGYGALIEELLDTDKADPLVIRHREEHPACKFFRIGDKIADAAREADPIDKKSWAKQSICTAMLDTMTRRVGIDGTIGPKRRKELEMARETLINKIKYEGFKIHSVDEEGTVIFKFQLALPDGRKVPMLLKIVTIKSDFSFERKGGGKDKKADEILDGLRMRFEIIDSELNFELSEQDVELITTYSYAFMLDIAGEDLPASMHKHLKYQHSGSEHSDQFLASKVFVETSSRQIEDGELHKVVTKAEVQIGLQSSFPDNHAEYVKNMLLAHRRRLGLDSYRKFLVNLMDYLCMTAPQNEEDWRELEEFMHHPKGNHYCRAVSIIVRTFLNPEGHHFKMITGRHYLPEMINRPDTLRRIKEIMRLIRKWPDKFRESGFDPEEALDLLDELMKLCQRKHDIYSDPRFKDRSPNGLIQMLWNDNLEKFEQFRQKLKRVSWTGKSRKTRNTESI